MPSDRASVRNRLAFYGMLNALASATYTDPLFNIDSSYWEQMLTHFL
jgi:hypothetical protein